MENTDASPRIQGPSFQALKPALEKANHGRARISAFQKCTMAHFSRQVGFVYFLPSSLLFPWHPMATNMCAQRFSDLYYTGDRPIIIRESLLSSSSDQNISIFVIVRMYILARSRFSVSRSPGPLCTTLLDRCPEIYIHHRKAKPLVNLSA